MSDQPKVSERMEKMVANAVEAAYRRGLFERSATSDPALEEKDTEATSALLSAIAEIEQRAGKWERVAVALQKCRLHPQSDKVYSELDDAIAALGNEWDETVR